MWLLALTAAFVIAASDPTPEHTQSTIDYRETTYYGGTTSGRGGIVSTDGGRTGRTDRTLKYRDSRPSRAPTDESAIANVSTVLQRVDELPAFNRTELILDYRNPGPSGQLRSNVSKIVIESSTVLGLRESPTSIRSDPTEIRESRTDDGKPSKASGITYIDTIRKHSSAQQLKDSKPSAGGSSSSSAFPYMDDGTSPSEQWTGVRRVEESPAYASSVVLASDILSLSQAVAGARGALCREQGYRFLDGLLMNKRWALKMFDASAKSPQGLLFGSSYHLGNFDECVGISEENEGKSRLAGQYCLATIEWPQSEDVRKCRSGRSGELRWAVCTPASCDSAAVRQFVLDVLARTVSNVGSVIVMSIVCVVQRRSGRSGELRCAVCTPASCDSAAVRQFVLDVLARTVSNVGSVIVMSIVCVVQRRSGRSGELRWAVCTPASCDSAAVRQFVLDVLARTVGNVSSVIVDEHDCYTRRPIQVNNLDIAFLCLMCFFVAVIFASTAYDVCRDRKGEDGRRRVLRDLVVSFSASHNLRKLLSTKQPNGFGLDCIAGIKTLAMVFITAGHACLFIASGPVMDAEAWDRLLRQPLNSFMLNNTLLVDSFLMLSAFLFSRLLLLELDKRRGRLNILPIYIFRYIRVTPAYLVVILFYMTWLPKSGEGPLWKDKIQLEQERCAATWWTNILYVNNYIHSDNLCMFQSWYLSVDTQLFLLAPAFIYPLWRWRRVGPAILVVAIAVSASVTAAVTYESSLDPTLMVYAKEFKDISQNHFFKDAYIKTHMKMTPYFMGLLFGYILHRVQANNYVFSRMLRIAAWVASVVLATSVVFSISIFYQDWYQYSLMDATSYAALHKLAWGLANGWLILACATGNGGFLGKLLTWKFLVPLSRLTFCAYLVNGIVELYYVGTLRHPLHISFFNVLAIGVAHIILTFILAVMLCLVFESPVHGIEKVLLRSFARPSDNARVDVLAENSSSRSTSQPKLDA